MYIVDRQFFSCLNLLIVFEIVALKGKINGHIFFPHLLRHFRAKELADLSSYSLQLSTFSLILKGFNIGHETLNEFDFERTPPSKICNRTQSCIMYCQA